MYPTRRPGSRDTDPASGASRPRATRSSVVLPAPLGPMSVTISPSPTARSTPSRDAGRAEAQRHPPQGDEGPAGAGMAHCTREPRPAIAGVRLPRRPGACGRNEAEEERETEREQRAGDAGEGGARVDRGPGGLGFRGRRAAVFRAGRVVREQGGLLLDPRERPGEPLPEPSSPSFPVTRAMLHSRPSGRRRRTTRRHRPARSAAAARPATTGRRERFSTPAKAVPSACAWSAGGA